MTKRTSFWVLIIEDDVLINKAYAAKFSHEGITVKFVQDGAKAMNLLKAGEKPSLILLDLMLPHRSGFEILETIRKNEQWKHIPVIILTNLAQKNDIAKGLALGANEYLIKANVKIEDIVKKIKKYMSNA